MGMIQTDKGTKKFTEKEKLSILKEAEKEGVKKTLSKYILSGNLLLLDKEIFESWLRR